jgi:hypothetical protein
LQTSLVTTTDEPLTAKVGQIPGVVTFDHFDPPLTVTKIDPPWGLET